MRLWFAGDVHLGDGGLPRLPLVGQGVVNLEGPIGSGASSPERLVNSSAAPLAEAGVRVAFVENNHADDDGEQGRARTLAALEAAHVAPAATAVLSMAGLRVVFMGVDVRRGVFAEELKAARAQGDVLVVGFHVVAPALTLPPDDLEVAAELALTHGAQVVVAHGSHALARVERRGSAVLALGLGNFSFACDCTTERDGLVLEVELDGEGHPARAWAVPILAGLHGEPPTLHPDPSLIFDQLQALASTPLRREGNRAAF